MSDAEKVEEIEKQCSDWEAKRKELYAKREVARAKRRMEIVKEALASGHTLTEWTELDEGGYIACKVCKHYVYVTGSDSLSDRPCIRETCLECGHTPLEAVSFDDYNKENGQCGSLLCPKCGRLHEKDENDTKPLELTKVRIQYIE